MPDSDPSAPTTKSLLLNAIHERDYETIDQLLSKGRPSAFKISREFTDKVCSLTVKSACSLQLIIRLVVGAGRYKEKSGSATH